MEQITAELTTIFRRFSYELEAGYFEGMLSTLRGTSSLPGAKGGYTRFDCLVTRWRQGSRRGGGGGFARARD